MIERSTSNSIGRGFKDPVMDAQRCFRSILTAMAEPGTVHTLVADVVPPSCLSPATAMSLLTLADHETPVWLGDGLADAAGYVRFHTASPLVSLPSGARFAVFDGAAMPALTAFDQGDDRYPDRSATLIVQCTALDGGTAIDLEGPGIRGQRAVAPCGVGADFWSDVAHNASRYPLGVDLMLVCGREIICLPRSTRVVGKPGNSGREKA
jgi:alpha-D-ribose 1-methylphosphonate 5-triphosphate synthase subunit PhnH